MLYYIECLLFFILTPRIIGNCFNFFVCRIPRLKYLKRVTVDSTGGHEVTVTLTLVMTHLPSPNTQVAPNVARFFSHIEKLFKNVVVIIITENKLI